MKKYLLLLVSFSSYASPVVHNRFNIHASHRIAHSGSITQSIQSGELQKDYLSEWDKFGNTPLHYAAFYNHEENIMSLIDNGVDIDARNQFGFTPLYYAINRDNQNAMIALVSNGANSYIKDTKGVSIREAASDSQLEIIDVVLIVSVFNPTPEPSEERESV